MSKPRLTRELAAEFSKPENTCKVPPFAARLDDESREVFEELLAREPRSMSAPKIRQILLAAGFADAPEAQAIKDHRGRRRPCRCE